VVFSGAVSAGINVAFSPASLSPTIVLTAILVHPSTGFCAYLSEARWQWSMLGCCIFALAVCVWCYPVASYWTLMSSWVEDIDFGTVSGCAHSAYAVYSVCLSIIASVIIYAMIFLFYYVIGTPPGNWVVTCCFYISVSVSVIFVPASLSPTLFLLGGFTGWQSIFIVTGYYYRYYALSCCAFALGVYVWYYPVASSWALTSNWMEDVDFGMVPECAYAVYGACFNAIASAIIYGSVIIFVLTLCSCWSVDGLIDPHSGEEDSALNFEQWRSRMHLRNGIFLLSGGISTGINSVFVPAARSPTLVFMAFLVHVSTGFGSGCFVHPSAPPSGTLPYWAYWEACVSCSIALAIYPCFHPVASYWALASNWTEEIFDFGPMSKFGFSVLAGGIIYGLIIVLMSILETLIISSILLANTDRSTDNRLYRHHPGIQQWVMHNWVVSFCVGVVSVGMSAFVVPVSISPTLLFLGVVTLLLGPCHENTLDKQWSTLSVCCAFALAVYVWCYPMAVDDRQLGVGTLAHCSPSKPCGNDESFWVGLPVNGLGETECYMECAAKAEWEGGQWCCKFQHAELAGVLERLGAWLSSSDVTACWARPRGLSGQDDLLWPNMEENWKFGISPEHRANAWVSKQNFAAVSESHATCKYKNKRKKREKQKLQQEQLVADTEALLTQSREVEEEEEEDPFMLDQLTGTSDVWLDAHELAEAAEEAAPQDKLEGAVAVEKQPAVAALVVVAGEAGEAGEAEEAEQVEEAGKIEAEQASQEESAAAPQDKLEGAVAVEKELEVAAVAGKVGEAQDVAADGIFVDPDFIIQPGGERAEQGSAGHAAGRGAKGFCDPLGGLALGTPLGNRHINSVWTPFTLGPCGSQVSKWRRKPSWKTPPQPRRRRGLY
jgi:hypothetical protein